MAGLSYIADTHEYEAKVMYSINENEFHHTPSSSMTSYFDTYSRKVCIFSTQEEIIAPQIDTIVKISFCVLIENSEIVTSIGHIKGKYEFYMLNSNNKVIGAPLENTFIEPVQEYPFIICGLPVTTLKESNSKFLTTFIFRASSGETIKDLYYFIVIYFPPYLKINDDIHKIKITINSPFSTNTIGSVINFKTKLILNIPHTKEIADNLVYITIESYTTNLVESNTAPEVVHIYGKGQFYKLFNQKIIFNASDFNAQINLKKVYKLANITSSLK